MDCNDANPYAICCDEPLTGFVALLYHDDAPVLSCRSLGRFLDLLVEKRRQVLAMDEEQREGDFELRTDRLEDDLAFDRPERSAEDARVGRALIRHAESLDPIDVDRGVALLFAAQMIGPGHEDELTRVMMLGDESVREAVLERHGGVWTRLRLRQLWESDKQEFDRFIEELAQAVVAAGMEIRRYPPPGYGFAITPGNLDVHFKRHFCKRHQPGFLPELIELLRRWHWEKMADPIDRLARSGIIQKWVAEQGGQWDHWAWAQFLRDATWRYGPLPADRVGLLLEEEKRQYWDCRNAANRSGDPS